MPAFEKMDRHQKILYWEFLRTNGVNEPIFASPVELKVRWVSEDKQVGNALGQPVASSISVCLDRPVVIGSLMWIAPEQGRGSKTAEEQWYGDSGSATNDELLMEVISTPITPSIHARFTRYMANLSFYKREVRNES
jgi:hypothetical protein